MPPSQIKRQKLLWPVNNGWYVVWYGSQMMHDMLADFVHKNLAKHVETCT